MNNLNRVIAPMVLGYEKGMGIYQILLENRLPDMEVVICPGHIGDTLWIACYADAYRKNYRCERLLFVVVEAQAPLMTLFEAVDDVLSISAEEMSALQIYIIFNRLWYNEHIRFAHFQSVLSVSDLGLMRVENYGEEVGNENYMNITRCHMLGIPLDSPKLFPKPPGVDPMLSAKYHNAVLLMPSALSQNNMPPQTFWTRLGKRLMNKGFDVYYNYNGYPTEMQIEDVPALSSTLIEMYQFAGVFRMFIGLRSGICDLLAIGNAPLMVIYPFQDHISTMEIMAEDAVKDNMFQLKPLPGLRLYQYDLRREDVLIETIISAL